MNVVHRSSRLIRWRLVVLEFSFDNTYKTEKSNAQADDLSLDTTDGTTVDAEEYEIPFFVMEVDQETLEDEEGDPFTLYQNKL